MPPQSDRPTLRQVAGGLVAQWGALALGLISCFLILLASKRLGAEVRVFCALGAATVIGLWLTTAEFRRDGMAFAASSTLALLPIAAIECGWIEIEGRGMALLVETFCIAILFVGALERLGREGVAAMIHVARHGVGRPALTQPARSRIIIVRCCIILIGLLAVPAANAVAMHQAAQDAPPLADGG